jgi:hypothetical protein
MSSHENKVTLQSKDFSVVVIRSNANNRGRSTEEFDGDTPIISPLPLDDNGNDNDLEIECMTYREILDRGWCRARKSTSTHLLLRLSVILSLTLPTSHAFQNHFYQPNYQQTWLYGQHIHHRENFHHGKLISKESSRIHTLKSKSSDDTNILSDSNVNTMTDVDHTTEARTLISSISIWERLAFFGVSRQYNIPTSSIINNSEDDITQFVTAVATPEQLYDYAQYISVFRVMIPSLGYATITKLIYPSIAMWVVSLIHGDSGVFAVVSQDSSQFIQNICTTSGLAFSILIGQTYYFMYQQQEKIYYAIYDEVAMAKMLLEQISLISRGRTKLYGTMLQQMDRYVRDDLQLMNDIDPATMLSSRPCDDPLEDILFLTSVGEPSQIYQSIRSLRQARAQRLGSLQMKLPEIQMSLLWILAAIVLLVFPLLGAGSQTIGGYAILQVQSWYISFLVFGISLVMGIIYELRSPNQPGAYNAGTILRIMISGLLEELQQRLQDTKFSSPLSVLSEDGANGLTTSDYNTTNFAYFDAGPSVDSDG